METKIYRALETLSLYDSTLYRVLQALDAVEADTSCDGDTVNMAGNLIIAILIDKVDALLPEDATKGRAVLDAAPGMDDVLQAIGRSASLLTMAVIGYAAALSESHWGWKPWERVREILLDKEDDLGQEDESGASRSS